MGFVFVVEVECDCDGDFLVVDVEEGNYGIGLVGFVGGDGDFFWVDGEVV